MSHAAYRRFSIVLALALAARLGAQEEPSLSEITRELRTKLTTMQRLLKAREDDLARRLDLLDSLTEAGRTIATSAPRTGRDAALAAIDEARAETNREPSLESELETALDRAEIEVKRDVVGELPAAAAARYAAELVPFALEINTLLTNFLGEAAAIRQVVDGFGQLGSREAQNASQALRKLYQLESRTLSLQEGMRR